MPRGTSYWEQSADPTALAIAEDLLERYDNNENNVQEIAKESPEFYRATMYTLYPDAAKIDGTSEYWRIVRYLEGIMINDGSLIMDWNDIPQSSTKRES